MKKTEFFNFRKFTFLLFVSTITGGIILIVFPNVTNLINPYGYTLGCTLMSLFYSTGKRI